MTPTLTISGRGQQTVSYSCNAVKSRARAAVVLFHLEPKQSSGQPCWLAHALFGFERNFCSRILPQHCSTMDYAQKHAKSVSWCSNCSKQQQAKQVTPFTNLKVSTANVAADSRSELWTKLSLHIMASNSQRGLPQRLSNKRLALIIPKSNKLLQRIKSSCQNSEKSRSTKTIQKQLRSTQSYSRDKLLLGNSQKASTFPPND